MPPIPPTLSSLKFLVGIASIICIGFGAWHFFVPGIWDWYSYIDESAPELIIAVRAINFFFSLLLVLIGIANIVLIFRKYFDRFSILVVLSLSVILWASRVALQFIYPQGTQNPVIQYSMLITFMVVFLCFLFALILAGKVHKTQIKNDPD